MFDDNRKKKEELERIKVIRAEQRLVVEKEEDEEEEDEEDLKFRKKKFKKSKEEVRNWNFGVFRNILSYFFMFILYV